MVGWLIVEFVYNKGFCDDVVVCQYCYFCVGQCVLDGCVICFMIVIFQYCYYFEWCFECGEFGKFGNFMLCVMLVVFGDEVVCQQNQIGFCVIDFVDNFGQMMWGYCQIVYMDVVDECDVDGLYVVWLVVQCDCGVVDGWKCLCFVQVFVYDGDVCDGQDEGEN